jgi:formylmethanofuran dehydrogenase subunit E
MGKFEFFVYRKKGIEPSQIPLPVRQEVIRWVNEQPDETIYKVEAKPGFTYTPPKGSFNRTKCSVCGEYVFERYIRMKDGQPMCIPCSGFTESRLDVLKGMQ